MVTIQISFCRATTGTSRINNFRSFISVHKCCHDSAKKGKTLFYDAYVYTETEFEREFVKQFEY